MATASNDFRDVQRQFTAHLRNPTENPPPPNLEDRRMAIYRRLIFANLRSLLGKRFKVIKAILGDEAWSNIIRDFLIRHRAKTPLFPELNREFLYYLQDHYDTDSGHPFMLELAHYEWAGLTLRDDEASRDDVQTDQHTDLLNSVPILSPVAWLMGYSWPVHRIRPEFIPEQKPEQPSWLMIYRNSKETVAFMELTAGTARLCQLMQDNLQDNQRRTGLGVLEQFAAEINRAGDQQVIAAGHQQLLSLHRKGIILGTQSAE